MIPGSPRPKDLAIGASLISLQIAVTLLASYGVLVGLSTVIPSNPQVALSLSLRLSGLIGVVSGITVAVITLRHRPPRSMLLSTSVTLRKLFGLTNIGSSDRRTEPFLVAGPYRYVRNPLYLGVLLVVFGSSVLFSSALLFVWGVILACWFSLLLIPFEEKELEALFAQPYRTYRQHVPMLLPYRRPYSPASRAD